MLQNDRVTVFTVSELLRKNQQIYIIYISYISVTCRYITSKKLVENEFRRKIYQKITGKCLQDLSDNLPENRKVCKAFL